MALAAQAVGGCPGTRPAAVERDVSGARSNTPAEGAKVIDSGVMDSGAMDSGQAIVKTGSDVGAHAGSPVLVHGTYTEVDMRKAPAGDPVYAGHAAVKLADDSLVMLAPPWHDDALRSQEERDNLRGKAVIAEGILQPVCPPDGTGLALQVPCLFPALFVLTPDIYEMLHSDDDDALGAPGL